VGEGGVGKSNLLAAISTLLEPVALPLAREDAWRGGRSDTRFATTLASGTPSRFGAARRVVQAPPQCSSRRSRHALTRA